MTDTTITPHINREQACRIGDAHGWNTEDSDGNIVYAWKDKFRVTAIFPQDNPWEGAIHRIRVSYQLTDDTFHEVELSSVDDDVLRWALEVFGQDPLPPFTEWALEHGLPIDTPASHDVRMQWHYQTGTGDPEDWEGVPAEWGDFNGWRSRFAR